MTDQQPTSRNVRLHSIDALRGAAALAVVFAHAVPLNDSTDFLPPLQYALAKILSYGFLGVPLFFVVSGFCIHQQWTRGVSASPDYKLSFLPFWVRRLHRLYVPYFAALVLSMAAVLVAYLQGIDVPLVTNYPEPRLQWMLADFVAHVTMLFGLHPLFDQGGGNVVFWTLAREEYLYLLYLPLLLFRTRAGVRNAVLGVLLIGFGTALLPRLFLSAGSPWWGVIVTSAPVLWIQWCLGMLAVEHHHGLVKLPRWSFSLALLPLACAAALYAEWNAPLLTPLLWGCTFFVLVMYCTTRESERGWTPTRITGSLASVGLFSYSLYLVHYPIRSVVRTLLAPVLPVNTPAAFWITAALAASAGIAGGWLFYQCVERHFLARRPEAARARRPAPSASMAPAVGT